MLNWPESTATRCSLIHHHQSNGMENHGRVEQIILTAGESRSATTMEISNLCLLSGTHLVNVNKSDAKSMTPSI